MIYASIKLPNSTSRRKTLAARNEPGDQDHNNQAHTDPAQIQVDLYIAVVRLVEAFRMIPVYEGQGPLNDQHVRAIPETLESDANNRIGGSRNTGSPNISSPGKSRIPAKSTRGPLRTAE